ncbi:MAG: hypothetical protein GWO07_08700 [Candidatus Dadabacteria bacterium]|nr:hypothetical protein [Candidatus Dadabacteria bacterium]NIS08826.1 hypothetical protein [Candidatus Dadabacteria bacterium]NIY22176.1 hypothetical protein [Candidatus Dadabacteria bacterium]
MVVVSDNEIFSLEQKAQILGIDFKVLTKTYLYDLWTLNIKRLSRNRLGLCNYIDKSIDLNLDYLEVNGLQSFQNTLKHEIAHAMVYENYRCDKKWLSIKPHGTEWKSAALSIGVIPKRCPESEQIKPKFNYWLECKVHGVIESWIRRPGGIDRDKWSQLIRTSLCPKCGQEGVENYLDILHNANSA